MMSQEEIEIQLQKLKEKRQKLEKRLPDMLVYAERFGIKAGFGREETNQKINNEIQLIKQDEDRLRLKLPKPSCGRLNGSGTSMANRKRGSVKLVETQNEVQVQDEERKTTNEKKMVVLQRRKDEKGKKDTPLKQFQSRSEIFFTKLLFKLSTKVPQFGNRQGSLLVAAAGLLYEKDGRGRERQLIAKSDFSCKGQGEVHAEEKVFKKIKEKYHRESIQRTHASQLGFLMLVIHAHEYNGSMCSSCVCSLVRFLNQMGINLDLIQVKTITRPDKNDNDRMVTPISAFQDFVKATEKDMVLDALKAPQFLDSQVNNYDLDNSDESAKEVIGKRVVDVVKDIINDVDTNHWIHCKYKDPHPFESGFRYCQHCHY